MLDRSKIVVYSGGHRGTEAEFGRQAERWGLGEVTVSYEGHAMERDQMRQLGGGLPEGTSEEIVCAT